MVRGDCGSELRSGGIADRPSIYVLRAIRSANEVIHVVSAGRGNLEECGLAGDEVSRATDKGVTLLLRCR